MFVKEVNEVYEWYSPGCDLGSWKVESHDHAEGLFFIQLLVNDVFRVISCNLAASLGGLFTKLFGHFLGSRDSRRSHREPVVVSLRPSDVGITSVHSVTYLDLDDVVASISLPDLSLQDSGRIPDVSSIADIDLISGLKR